MREVCRKLVYQDPANPKITTGCTKDVGHDGNCQDPFGNTRSPEGIYMKWSDRRRIRQ